MRSRGSQFRAFASKAQGLVESRVPQPLESLPEGGWSTAPLVIFCLLLMPLPTSGAARYLTSWPMPWCLAVGVLSSFVVAALWWPLRDRRRKPVDLWLSAAVGLLLVSGFAFDALYDPRVYGFPTTGAIDAVGHLVEVQGLAGPNPQTYWGMNAFQATSYWLMALGLEPFWAFWAVTHALFFCAFAYVALAQAMLAARLHDLNGSPGLAWLLALLTLLVGYGPFLWFVLPMLHGCQLDGYFPQLHGLVPLFTCALLYAVASSRWARLLGVGLGVVLLRFTYLLNVVDCALTCALLVAHEALAEEPQRARRYGLLTLAAVGVVLSGHGYRQLYDIADGGGGMAAPNMALRLLGTAGLALGMLALPRLSGRLLLHPVPVSVTRLTRFVGTYGTVATAVQCVWSVGVYSRPHDADDLYLLHKYGFSAALLLVLTAIPVVAYVLTLAVVAQASFLRPRRAWGAVASLAVAAGAALGHVGSVPDHYRATFRSRRTRTSDAAIALVDLDAWDRIREVLRATQRDFGCFLAPLTAETHFVGWALRRRPSPDVLPYLEPSTGMPPAQDYPLVDIADPGRCVFWLSPSLFEHFAPLRGAEQARFGAVRRLHRGPKACLPYWRRSYRHGIVELCYTCFEGSAFPAQAALGSARRNDLPRSTTGRTPAAPFQATVSLSPAPDERCHVRLRGQSLGNELRFDGIPLELVTPRRFPIPAELLRQPSPHAVAIPAFEAAVASPHAAAEVVCVRSAVPANGPGAQAPPR